MAIYCSLHSVALGCPSPPAAAHVDICSACPCLAPPRPLLCCLPSPHQVLDLAHITLNKNSVPGDQSAVVPGGIRVGTPALTTRGFREADFVQVADFLHRGIQIAQASAGAASHLEAIVCERMWEVFGRPACSLLLTLLLLLWPPVRQSIARPAGLQGPDARPRQAQGVPAVPGGRGCGPGRRAAAAQGGARVCQPL